MGQKSNPNSFVINKKKTIAFGGSSYPKEYAALLKESSSVVSNFIFLFEKNKCFVRFCFSVPNNEKFFTTVFISFLVWKKRKNKTKLSLNTNQSFTQNLFYALEKNGNASSKRLIFQNLNKISFNHQKNLFKGEHTKIKKKLFIYRHEIYFESGLMLFCLLNTTKNISLLFAKFISKFFKVFHRTRKINKFLRFLQQLIKNMGVDKANNIRVKGVKVSINGRFSGSSRTKIRIFEKGQIPLQTFKHNIAYTLTHTHTSYGIFGVKVWVFE